MILVRLCKTFRTAFSVCLYRLFEVSYDCLNIWWYTHVWSCLTNCEKTVRCDADLIDDSCEASKDLSNGVTAFSVCLYRLFEVSYGCLNIWGLCHRCEVASLILKKLWGVTQIWLMILVRLWKTLSNGVFRMSLSTFWGELWLFEYMVIYTCVELPH